MRLTLGRTHLRLALDWDDLPLDYQYRFLPAPRGGWLRAWRIGLLSVILSRRGAGVRG